MFSTEGVLIAFVVCGMVIPQIEKGRFLNLKILIMSKKLQKFSEILKELRIKKGLTLRGVCKLSGYDPSNWSKIERGKLAPPSEKKVLEKWAKILDLKKGNKQFQEFIDYANIAQGIIPYDILSEKELVGHLPILFRTLRNEKPTKEEIDKLIEIISKNS